MICYAMLHFSSLSSFSATLSITRLCVCVCVCVCVCAATLSITRLLICVCVCACVCVCVCVKQGKPGVSREVEDCCLSSLSVTLH